MALSKFSQFKKERSSIKEAREKEVKVKKFNKMFAEKLHAMGKKSVAELTEDEMNTLFDSLKTKPVNEDRMREIEADGIAAGTPQELGAEGSESEAERAKKYTFDSPQSPDAKAEDKAEDIKAEEAHHESEVDESKKAVKEDEEEDKGVEDVEKGEEDEDKGGEEEDKGDVKVDSEDDAEKKDHYKGAVKSDDAEIEKDKAEIKDLKKDAEFDKKKEEEEEEELEEVAEAKVVEADEIKNDAEFDAYADEVLKKAHPDDFDEKIAKKIKDGLKKKYKDDYGAAVGALTSGFGK